MLTWNLLLVLTLKSSPFFTLGPWRQQNENPIAKKNLVWRAKTASPKDTTHALLLSSTLVSAHKHTCSHTVMPAGRWWLAWCCHQGILGGVCRKGRGVNWVNAGCKEFWVKTWYSSSWCFVTHTPHEIQVVGKVKRKGRRRRGSLAQLSVVYYVCIRTVSSTVSFTAALSLTCLRTFFAVQHAMKHLIGFRTLEQKNKVWARQRELDAVEKDGIVMALTTSKQVYPVISYLSTWRWWNLKV